jgi:uncharacterized membrane protein YkoI
MNQTIKALALASTLVLAGISFGQGVHAKIGAGQAKKVALAKYRGTVVGKVPLENEDGSWQYAVTIRSGKLLREVMVDAMTGKIANVEITTAREEAREAAQKPKTKKHGKI